MCKNASTVFLNFNAMPFLPTAPPSRLLFIHYVYGGGPYAPFEVISPQGGPACGPTGDADEYIYQE